MRVDTIAVIGSGLMGRGIAYGPVQELEAAVAHADGRGVYDCSRAER